MKEKKGQVAPYLQASNPQLTKVAKPGTVNDKSVKDKAPAKKAVMPVDLQMIHPNTAENPPHQTLGDFNSKPVEQRIDELAERIKTLEA